MELLPVLFACTLFVLVYSSYGAPGYATERIAICNVEPNSAGSDQPVRGVVIFRQKYHRTLNIDVQLSGFKHLPPTAYDTEYLHGFHIHEFGNLTGGCDATGGHYNPYKKNHGAPEDKDRHAGDFGNLRQTPDGKVNVQFTDTIASLFGDTSIFGRGLVVHANVDDLGKGNNTNSKINGNAGKRLACCVIGHAASDIVPRYR
ncbi:hypothetical protein BsWGS_12588 [Bradybaena similaris]